MAKSKPKQDPKLVMVKAAQALEFRFTSMGFIPEYWKLAKSSYTVDDEPFYQNILRLLTPDDAGQVRLTKEMIQTSCRWCMENGYHTIRNVVEYIFGGLTQPVGSQPMTEDEAHVMGELRKHEAAHAEPQGVPDKGGNGVILHPELLQ